MWPPEGASRAWPSCRPRPSWATHGHTSSGAASTAPSAVSARSSDAWITTKVKSWLLGSSDTEGLRVKVVTENGVVYLMGLVTAAEAQRIADKASGISGVQRVVKLFEVVG